MTHPPPIPDIPPDDWDDKLVCVLRPWDPEQPDLQWVIEYPPDNRSAITMVLPSLDCAKAAVPEGYDYIIEN